MIQFTPVIDLFLSSLSAVIPYQMRPPRSLVLGIRPVVGLGVRLERVAKAWCRLEEKKKISPWSFFCVLWINALS